MGKACFIIGTIYIDAPLKPNILDEITREAWIQAPPPREKYVSDKDSVLLEDESGRVTLAGDALKSELLTTGMIVGVLGSENRDGSFRVIDIMYPDVLEPQKPLPVEGSWIALVSGFDIIHHHDLKLQLLSDFLTGEVGTANSQAFGSQISRVIIAGNLLGVPSEEDIQKRTTKNQFGTTIVQYDPVPMQIADEVVASMVSGLDVDVMPGKQDAVSQIMPQQRIQPSMFAMSCRYSSFQTVTNPYSFISNDTCVLGTSGQNIDNMYQYLNTEDRMEIAKQTLKAMHIAPTCPDTLWSHSIEEKDPFIMSTTPHIYFIGNQPRFQTDLVENEVGKTRIVMVPKFSETGQAILVHTASLEVKVLSIDE